MHSAVITRSTATATADIIAAVRAWRVWGFMGTQDIKQRYRGSVLGPIWIAGGLVAVGLGVGILYASLFRQPIREFIPYAIAGLAVWTLFSASVTEGCYAFIVAAGLMKNSPLPIFLHVLRVISRNLIVFAHNLVVVILALLIMRTPVNMNAVWAIPGLVLVVLNIVWMTYIAALLSARFRDVAQILIYLMTFLMFLSPLFWKADTIPPAKAYFVNANPFYHMLAVTRDPLLGHAPAALNWEVLILMAVVGWAVTWFAHARFKRSVVFWL